jgi:hypothetical protein
MTIRVFIKNHYHMHSLFRFPNLSVSLSRFPNLSLVFRISLSFSESTPDQFLVASCQSVFFCSEIVTILFHQKRGEKQGSNPFILDFGPERVNFGCRTQIPKKSRFGLWCTARCGECLLEFITELEILFSSKVAIYAGHQTRFYDPKSLLPVPRSPSCQSQSVPSARPVPGS